jgi:hypothetical protein
MEATTARPWAAALLDTEPWSILGPRVPLPVAAVALETVKLPPPEGADVTWQVSVVTDIAEGDDGVLVTETRTVPVDYAMSNASVDTVLYGTIVTSLLRLCAADGDPTLAAVRGIHSVVTMCILHGEPFLVPWLQGDAGFRDMGSAMPGTFTVIAYTDTFVANFAARVVRPALGPTVPLCRLEVVCVRQDDLLPTPMLVADGGIYRMDLNTSLGEVRLALRNAPPLVDTFGDFAAAAVATGVFFTGTRNRTHDNNAATLREVFLDNPAAMHFGAADSLDTFSLVLVWPPKPAYGADGADGADPDDPFVYLHVIVGAYRATAARRHGRANAQDLDGNDMRALATLPQAMCRVRASTTVQQLRQGWRNATLALNPPCLASLGPAAWATYPSLQEVVVLGSAQPWAAAVRPDVTVADAAAKYAATVGPGTGAGRSDGPDGADGADGPGADGPPPNPPGPTHLYIMVRPPCVQAACRQAATRAWQQATAVTEAGTQSVQVTVMLADDGAIVAEVQVPFDNCTIAAVKAAFVAKRVATSVKALGELAHPAAPTKALAADAHAVQVCELLAWEPAKLEILCIRKE